MFDWHFTPIHTSSPSFATLVGSSLHALLGRFTLNMDSSHSFGSTPLNMRLLLLHRPFGLAFALAPPAIGLTY